MAPEAPDEDLGQTLALLQAFCGSLNQACRIYTPGSASEPGCSADHEGAGLPQPSVRLPECMQNSCRSFILKIERVKLQTAALQNSSLLTWLDERQQDISHALPYPGRCRLLELPAELRELIWIHAVVEWTASSDERDTSSPARGGQQSSCPTMSTYRKLKKSPIRMDHLNHPRPPSITLVSHQLRQETLHLWYQHNIFECWRPWFWSHTMCHSTLIDWLVSLGSRTEWLRDLVLLYKHQEELDEDDIESALVERGLKLTECAITNKLELTEYELTFDMLGLPKHFGKQRRRGRLLAGSVY